MNHAKRAKGGFGLQPPGPAPFHGRFDGPALHIGVDGRIGHDLHRNGFPSFVKSVVNGGGKPMERALRTQMESRFGHDFSQVRVHTHPKAAESAMALSAKAYAFGQDLVFGPHRYTPHTRDGQRLLAHELAHVVQQARGGSAPPFASHGPLEESADAAARALSESGKPIRVMGSSGVGVACSWLDDLQKNKYAKIAASTVSPMANFVLEASQRPEVRAQLEEKAGEVKQAYTHFKEHVQSTLAAVPAATSAGVAAVEEGLGNAKRKVTKTVTETSSRAAEKLSEAKARIPPKVLKAAEVAKDKSADAAVSLVLSPILPPVLTDGLGSALLHAGEGAVSGKAGGSEELKGFGRDKLLGTVGAMRGALTEVTSVADTLLWVGSQYGEARESVATSLTGQKEGTAHAVVSKGIDALANFVPGTGALPALSAANEAAKSAGLVEKTIDGKPTDKVSLTAPVADVSEKAITKIKKVVGGTPGEESFLSPDEKAEIATSVGIQGLLATVGAEEVHVALNLVGALGSFRSLVESTHNPEVWYKDMQFIGSLIGLTLAVVNMGNKLATKKLIKLAADVVMKAGLLAPLVPAFVQVYQDAHNKELTEEVRHAHLKAAFSQAVHTIRGALQHVITTQSGAKSPLTSEPKAVAEPPAPATTHEPPPLGRRVGEGDTRSSRPLTPAEFEAHVSTAESMGMPRDQIGPAAAHTKYIQGYDQLLIGPDINPLPVEQRPVGGANPANAALEPRAALGHEIIGHREAALAGQTRIDDWHEEFQASTRAALHAPDLPMDQRWRLTQDAAARRRFQERPGTIFVFTDRIEKPISREPAFLGDANQVGGSSRTEMMPPVAPREAPTATTANLFPSERNTVPAARGTRDDGRVVARKPRGFDTGRASPGRNVAPGSMEGLEPTSARPVPAPRKRGVTRAQQLEGIDTAKRADPTPFMNDALKSVSDPSHPLHRLVQQDESGTADWHKTERITKRGKVQIGRYEGNESNPVVQAGHRDAHAARGEQVFMLEDADANQTSGQVIESKGGFSFKERVFVTKLDGSDGVWVERESLGQWERLEIVPKGTLERALKHPKTVLEHQPAGADARD